MLSSMGRTIWDSLPLDNGVTISLAVAALILACRYVYETKFNYWKRYGCTGEPTFAFVSFITELVYSKLDLDMYRVKKYGRIHGALRFLAEQIVVADPKIIQQICIKDFDCFVDHKPNPFNNSYQNSFLFFLKGDHWKRVRAIMSPAFTSGRMRRMYRLLSECCEDMIDNFIEQLGARGGKEMNPSATYGMLTMDGITTCGYGIKLKREKGVTSVKELGSRNAFVKVIDMVFKIGTARVMMLALFPKRLLFKMGYQLIPEKHFKPLADLLHQAVKKRAKEDKSHDDLLQMLLDAKLGDKLELSELDQAENHHAGLTSDDLIKDHQKLLSRINAADLENKPDTKSLQAGKTKVKLNEHEIISEALFLMAAGMETTRTMLTSATYALAHHPAVQDRLHDELMRIVEFDEGKESYTFPYDTLTSCHYLDSVLCETLRVLPPIPFMDRYCTKDYYIEKYNVTIPRGASVSLAIYVVSNDPEYWDDPQKFDPERFMPGRREHIVPGSYLPFGIGPRHCVGMRFALTEGKLALAKAVMKFRFSPAPETKWPPKANFIPGLVMPTDPRVVIEPRAGPKN